MTALSTIDDLIAHAEISRTQGCYGDIITRRAFEELHTVMAPQCSVTVSLVDKELQFVGPTQIGSFISKQMEAFEFFEFVILNSVIELDLARNQAAARMYIQEIRTNSSDGNRSDTFGVYHDRFERTADGGWHFAERFYQSYARTNPPTQHRTMTVFELPELELSSLLDR